jgi:hypothetical protein
MTDPDTRLSRRAVAEALTEAGFPISPATLATYACRGGGPQYCMFNSRVLYRFGDALEWAKSRTSKPMTSASEGRAA